MIRRLPSLGNSPRATMREALFLAFSRSNERMAALFERSLEIIRIGCELREESARLKVLGRALKRGPRVPVEVKKS